MKKALAIFAITILSVFSYNHCTAQTDSAHITMQQMITLDLSGAGINATMQVPAGTMAQNVGGPVIFNDKSFAIRAEIVNGSYNLNTIRDNAENDEMNKFKRYIVNNDSTVLYESLIRGDRIEFLLHALVKIDDIYYHLYNEHGMGRYSEQSAIAMYEAIKTIKAK